MNPFSSGAPTRRQQPSDPRHRAEISSSDDDDSDGSSEDEDEISVSKPTAPLTQQSRSPSAAPLKLSSPPLNPTSSSVPSSSQLPPQAASPYQPQTSAATFVASSLGPSLSDLAPLVATHARKNYASGFVYLLVGPVSGVPAALADMAQLGWVKYWAELTGSLLALFQVPEDMAAASYFPNPSVESIMNSEGAPSTPPPDVLKTLKSSLPRVLSLSNALSEILPFGFQPPLLHTDSPPPPTPYDICIAVNLTASNLVFLSFRSSIAANHWVTGIRLSQFEASKINHHITLRRLGSPAVTADATSEESKSEPEGVRAWRDLGLTPFKTTSVGQVKGFGTPMHFEGWVRCKVGYNTAWSLFYAVVGNVVTVGDYSDKSGSTGNLAEKKENRGSFLKLFKNKNPKRGSSNPADSNSEFSSSNNVYLVAAGGASSFRNPDISFFQSKDSYRAAPTKHLFRIENVGHAFLDYITYFSNSAIDLCEIDPTTMGLATVRDGASIPAVKISGTIISGSVPLSDKSDSASSSKTAKSFLGVSQDPRIIPSDYIQALAANTDPRPAPDFLHMVPCRVNVRGTQTELQPQSMGAAGILDALRWVTATLGTFHLEANLIGKEVELRDGDIGLTAFNPAILSLDSSSSPLVSSGYSAVGTQVGATSSRDFGILLAGVEAGKSGWGLLFLKTDEVAGLSQAPPETGATAAKTFELVLQDKKSARKSGFADKWVDAVAKGVDARIAVEKGEVLEKVKGLISWLEAQKPPQTSPRAESIPKTNRNSGAIVHDVPQAGDDQAPPPPDHPPPGKQTAVNGNESEGEDAEATGKDAETGISRPSNAIRGTDSDADPDFVKAQEKLAAPTTSGPEIVKTDLVLVAVPALQPDGTWAWQYQFANQSAVESTAGGPVQPVVPTIPKAAMALKPASKEPNGDSTDVSTEEGEESDDSSDNVSLAASMHSASKRQSVALSTRAASNLNRPSSVMSGNSAASSPMMMASQLNSTYGVGQVSPSTPASGLANRDSSVSAAKKAAMDKRSGSRLSQALAPTDAESDGEESGEGSQSDESRGSGDSDEDDEEEEGDMDGDGQQQNAMNPMMMGPGMPFLPGMLPPHMVPGMPNFPPGAAPGAPGAWPGMIPFPGLLGMPGPPPPGMAFPTQEQTEEDEKPFKIYAENSLLAQLPEKTASGALLDKSPSRSGQLATRSGPLISLPSDVKEAQEKALKMRTYELAIKSIGLGGTGQVDPSTLGLVPRPAGASFPMPGLMPKPAPPPKPKIEGGLLGEVDKWEKEREVLRRMGGFRASMMMPPPNQFMPQSRPVSSAIDSQQAMYLQQQLMQQQQQQQGMPLPNQMFPGDFGAGGYPPQMQYNQMPGPGMYNQQYPGQMPPQMMQQGQVFPGYPYSDYGFDGTEDPALAANHYALRQQWLETERIKEQQRMMERGELPNEKPNGASSGSSDVAKTRKAKQAAKGKTKKKYDSSDSEEDSEQSDDSSLTASDSDDDDDDSSDNGGGNDSGSSESSDRQSLASRRHKLSKRQSTAMLSVRSSQVGQQRAPSEHSDSPSRASSGGVPFPGMVGAGPPPQAPGMPMPGPGMQQDFNRPGMYAQYQQQQLPGSGYPYGYPGGPGPMHPQQQQNAFNDPYQAQRMPYNQPGPGMPPPSLTGAANPAAAPAGRLMGERKRPTMPMVNASEAAAAEEAERKERERERRRRLRRRGVEVEESTEEEEPEEPVPTLASVEVRAPPAPPAETRQLQEAILAASGDGEHAQIAGGKEMLEDGELDKLLERANRKKKASAPKKQSGGESSNSSSSDEEIVIIRRKKKGKSKSKKKEKHA
ncbi:hypothetical protein HDU80_000770 [Chytriomyces hyalinus]|nr:hypothetical protein HDU80_000770 [Chytriomyces hyalinus]